MKTICIPLFQFSELSPGAQQNALRQCRFINVRGPWYELYLENFCDFLESIGIITSPHRISFYGIEEAAQGGSSFSGEVNIGTLLKSHIRQQWTKYFSEDMPKVKPCPADKRIFPLLDKGLIEVYPFIRPSNGGAAVAVTVNFHFNPFPSGDYPHIENEIDKLSLWTGHVVSTLNTFLFQLLQHSYQHLISDEQVSQAIALTGYDFTAEGNRVIEVSEISDAIQSDPIPSKPIQNSTTYQQILDACHKKSKRFLVNALNEALAQRAAQTVTEQGADHGSKSLFAQLVADQVRLTGKRTGDKHFIDPEGNYFITLKDKVEES